MPQQTPTKPVQHKQFTLTRNLVVQEAFTLEAMHERHAKARLKRLIEDGRAPEPVRSTIRVGHLKLK